MYYTHHMGHCAPNNEYASKAQGTTAVTLASVLGGIGTLGALSNGGLGGIFGGGNNAAKDAEIAQLKAEKYSDNAAKEEANRLLQNYLKPYGDAIAIGQVENAKLAARVDCLEKTQALEHELTRKEIQLARQEAQCCCQQTANAVANIAATLNRVTSTVISNDAVCPGWGNVTVAPATAAAA